MSPRISLILATYNRAGPLDHLLRGVERQTLDTDAFQVVVCVDGSTDSTAEVLEDWTRRAAFQLHVVRQDNQGQAAARHTAIERAATPRIAIVDDDMELSPRFLEEHLREAARDPERIVVMGKILPEKNWRRKPLYEAVRDEHMMRGHPEFERGRPLTSYAFVTGNVSVPRALYLAVGGFDRSMRLDEDRELGYRLLEAGAVFRFGKDASAIHRSDVGSYDTWERQQYEYGLYAVRIWNKHGRDPSVHPLRNFVDGHYLNRLVVRLLSRSRRSARVASAVLRAIGNGFAAVGVVEAGLATHKGILAIQYHLGVMHELGSWTALLEEADAYRRQGPELRTG